MEATYIEVKAGVRYWEDATINGVEDKDGKLTPFRTGDNWAPKIELNSGRVVDWPEGLNADIHFKVCDDGEYWLLDDKKNRIAKWNGFYVPNDFLCHGDSGYGDYIIMKIDVNGNIEDYKKPSIKIAKDDDDETAWRAL